jgi:hypothetical protein
VKKEGIGVGITHSLALLNPKSQFIPIFIFTGTLRWLWYGSEARHNSFFSLTLGKEYAVWLVFDKQVWSHLA